MQYALMVEVEYCTGCHSCEVACRNEHGYDPQQFGIKLNQVGPFVLDEKEDKFVWDYHPSVTTLCDFCETRLERGERPACELHCLASAIKVAPLEQIAKEAAEIGSKIDIQIP